jgi:hypothetical protein
MAESWLEPYITSILTDKKGILDHWRRQKKTLYQAEQRTSKLGC